MHLQIIFILWCCYIFFKIKTKLLGIAFWPLQVNIIFSPRRAAEKYWRTTENSLHISAALFLAPWLSGALIFFHSNQWK